MTNPTFDPASTEPFEPVAPDAPAGAAPGPAFQPVAPEPGGVPVQTVVQPVKRSSGGSSRILNVALGVAVLVATAGIAFAAGRATAPVSAATVAAGSGIVNGDANGGFRGNGGAIPGGNGGGFVPGTGAGGAGRFGFGGGLSVTGTVDSVTADSVTIKTASGQTITVGLDGTTTYHQQADATASDVQAGTTVIVRMSGGFRPGTAVGNGTGGTGNGTGGTGNGGSATLGAASDITVVP